MTLEAFQLPFFRTALVAILVLAGIHAYLGYHVVRRGVIFVDLALAQMAGLGLAIAVALGLEDDPVLSFLLPLAMTLVGAASFGCAARSATRRSRRSSASCSPPPRPASSSSSKRARPAPST
jgi:ABC-type Mn2+/Zn2+ transport system permease subunit